MGGLSLALGTYGAEADVSTRVKSFEYRFANNPFNGHVPGGGQLATRAEAGAHSR